MAVLERGGNAFDAACAAGFVLQVVEPHLNGPGGDLPAVFWPAEAAKPLVLCAQGVSPAGATIEAFRSRGHVLVPGTGVEAACVPGSFGGWLLLLEQFGTWTLDEVLAYAIGYAEHGYPVVEGITATIERAEPLLRRVARVGRALPAGCEARLDLPQSATRCDLAPRARRVGRDGRERAPRLLRGLRRRGDRPLLGGAGRLSHGRRSRRPGGATLEPPATVDYRGLTVCKTAAWGQGPAALQQLRLLEGFDVGALSDAELVHVLTEAAKLAFADRDANYGDVDVQLHHLLSPEYADERRALIGEDASGELRPGLGRLPQLVATDV